MNERYKLYYGDCLEIMPTLEAGSIDAVITDPPYGTTACSWDTVIPFAPMWEAIKHVRKPRAAVVLFGSEPFSSHLRLSNIKEYKYDWIWEKSNSGDFMTAKTRPRKTHEIVSVFYGHEYYPQMRRGKPYTDKPRKRTNRIAGSDMPNLGISNNGDRYPKSVVLFKNHNNIIHPTQKPVPLLRYLIRTYTNEGDTILDFTCGSGSAGVAAMLEKRNYIGIDNGYCEKENSEWNGRKWVDVAEWRIKNAAGEFTLTDKEKSTGQMSLL